MLCDKETGSRLNMPRYRESYYEYEMVVWPYYLCNWNPCTAFQSNGKTWFD